MTTMCAAADLLCVKQVKPQLHKLSDGVERRQSHRYLSKNRNEESELDRIYYAVLMASVPSSDSDPGTTLNRYRTGYT